MSDQDTAVMQDVSLGFFELLGVPLALDLKFVSLFENAEDRPDAQNVLDVPERLGLTQQDSTPRLVAIWRDPDGQQTRMRLGSRLTVQNTPARHILPVPELLAATCAQRGIVALVRTETSLAFLLDPKALCQAAESP